ncbi:endonuclease/exonuclease/phosphatase family protein [Flavobacterium sp. SM2513]|uniref:endonuclease/exonuclease/phosphatase family protein n=1 Tax=Flavobacterium sp. SM2513 TaxID=3424766 RepID=UPI003D7FA0E3
MKIATWNIERLKHKSALPEIHTVLVELNADILVLTETDSRIHLSKFKTCITTPSLSELDAKTYSQTEHRVAIYTNYEVINQFETCDNYTSLCVEVATPKGNLIIYGTIIGIYGNRNPNFKTDLLQQIADIESLSKKGNFCFIGDYNTSFSDNYYFTNYGRIILDEAFEKNTLKLVTRNQPECIDHIAISKSFITDKIVEIQEWNHDKKLSDHKGIAVHLKSSTVFILTYLLFYYF